MPRTPTREDDQPEPAVRVVRCVAFLVALAILVYVFWETPVLRFVVEFARCAVRLL